MITHRKEANAISLGLVFLSSLGLTVGLMGVTAYVL